MGSLAKQLSGQSQQVKMYAKGGKVAAFEKSGKDVEVKGKGKEGSKKEEAFDKTQMKKGGSVPKSMLKKGGKCV
jgi:hypothetical protein